MKTKNMLQKKRPVQEVPREYTTNQPNRPPPPEPTICSSPLTSSLALSRSETDDFQTRPPLSLTEHHNPLASKTRPPNGITRFRQLPHKLARLHIPQFDASVVPAGNDESLIKL